MKKKIITTVGTSIFTNYQDGNVKAMLGRDYAPINTPFERTHMENGGSEVPASGIYADAYRSYVRSLIEIITDFWYEYPVQGHPNEGASAEISSILKIAEQEKDPCEVHLVATDTLQSVLAAELIVGWFEKFPSKHVSKVLFQRQDTVFENQQDSKYVVKDLRVRSQQDFMAGFMNLVELLEGIYVKDKTILNITGGYKGIIPVLTLFGQLFEIPLKYLYVEDALSKQESPIVIGNLPIHFDLGYIENYVLYLENLDRIDQNTAVRMYKLGLLTNSQIPARLSIVGKLIKNKLESDDLPFQKTTLGYMVEYKLYEFYNLNKLDGYGSVTLGFKLSDDPNLDMEDADLWFDNSSNKNVIAAEIKPATFSAKKMTKKIKKNINLIQQLPDKSLTEFWIILYEFGNDIIINYENWCNKVFNDELRQEFSGITFCVKKISITHNTIDGNRNRINYQEFMRSRIEQVQDIFRT